MAEHEKSETTRATELLLAAAIASYLHDHCTATERTKVQLALGSMRSDEVRTQMLRCLNQIHANATRAACQITHNILLPK